MILFKLTRTPSPVWRNRVWESSEDQTDNDVSVKAGTDLKIFFIVVFINWLTNFEKNTSLAIVKLFNANTYFLSSQNYRSNLAKAVTSFMDYSGLTCIVVKLDEIMTKPFLLKQIIGNIYLTCFKTFKISVLIVSTPFSLHNSIKNYN